VVEKICLYLCGSVKKNLRSCEMAGSRVKVCKGKQGKLRIPPIHCKSPTWWPEFDIYIEIRNWRKFISIGNLPRKPQRICESPLRDSTGKIDNFKGTIFPIVNPTNNQITSFWITTVLSLQLFFLGSLAFLYYPFMDYN